MEQPIANPAPAPTPPASVPAAPAAPAPPTVAKGPDWAMWVSVAVISLTFVNLVLQISLHKKQHAQIGKDSESLKKDISEVKMNVKGILKDKYQSV
jgi:hypothetical protein